MAELKNRKHELFCREYIIDLNGTQAAIRADFSEKTANRIASRLLSRVDIQGRIAELRSSRIEEVRIDANYVLKRLIEIDQMDVLDILDEKMAFRPISEWPKVWRQYLSGVDVSELFEGAGDEREMVGVLKKIKWPDKVKNLELLGKHVRVGAFKEQLDHTSSDGSMTPKGTINIGELSDSAMAEILKARDAADS